MRTYRVKIDPDDMPAIRMMTLSFQQEDTNKAEEIMVDILLQIEAQDDERNRERTWEKMESTNAEYRLE